MRSRLFLSGFLLLLLLGADTPNLPSPKPSKGQSNPDEDEKFGVYRLKKERAALAREREDAAKDIEPSTDYQSVERVKLRLQMAELLKKLSERKTIMPGPEVSPLPKLPEDGSRSLDPLNQALSLYKAGSFEGSLRAFRLIDTSALNAEDRSFVQYMIASCLRRQGKLSESAVVYRDVADARDDAFIAECAVWQLSNIRWRKDLETQLEDLRQRRKAR